MVKPSYFICWKNFLSSFISGYNAIKQRSDFFNFGALLHSICNLKAAQMSVQHSLIQEIMLYEFKQDHNISETTQNICFAKGEGADGHSTLI